MCASVSVRAHIDLSSGLWRCVRSFGALRGVRPRVCFMIVNIEWDVTSCMNVVRAECVLGARDATKVLKCDSECRTPNGNVTKYTRTARSGSVRCAILGCGRIVKLKTNERKKKWNNRSRDIYPMELLRCRPLSIRFVHFIRLLFVNVNQLPDTISLSVTTR